MGGVFRDRLQLRHAVGQDLVLGDDQLRLVVPGDVDDVRGQTLLGEQLALAVRGARSSHDGVVVLLGVQLPGGETVGRRRIVADRQPVPRLYRLRQTAVPPALRRRLGVVHHFVGVVEDIQLVVVHDVVLVLDVFPPRDRRHVE